MRACTDRPLAIGFGISSPEQAALMAQLGDAVIVGSAIVSLVEQYAADREEMLQQVSALVGSLKQAISRLTVRQEADINQTAPVQDSAICSLPAWPYLKRILLTYGEKSCKIKIAGNQRGY